jgi:uncharacterized membrane protein
MSDVSTEAAGPITGSWVLTPYRSLRPAGFLALMLAVAAVSFTVGLGFWWIGAWPVLGFFGLDAGLLYLAFHLNYRQARAFERIDLLPGSLEVLRTDASGRIGLQRSFNPYWTRLELTEDPAGRSELAVSSHGSRLVIARCLSDGERREFAGVLARALATHRWG